MRVFISINIPEEIKKDIAEIQDSLPEFEGKKTEYENLHLTLKFLGEIDEKILEEVKDRLEKIKFSRFETGIDAVGFFDNRKSRKFSQNLIVWFHLLNCEKLQKEIDNYLDGLFEKEKRFMSHLTIARIKKIKDKKKFFDELSRIKIKEQKFTIDKFYLMKSELNEKGPVYSVVEEFSLL